MSTFQDYSLIGKGLIHLDGRAVGNGSVFSNQAEQEKKELLDFTNAAGGLYNSHSRLSAVRFAMTLHDFSPENLAMALRGSTAAVAQATENESITTGAALDLLIKTAKLVDTSQSYSVTSDPAGTTYTEGTDYTMSAAGVTVLSGGSMAASTGYLVNYESLEGDKIEALLNSGTTYELVLDGLDESHDGAPFRLTIYKAKPDVAEEMAWIGDEFAELVIAGDCLKDTTKNGTTESQYMLTEIADKP